MNSIGIANNHMCRSQMYPSEAWGKPRDAKRLPEPRGNGFWTQEIYYHMLNSGLRLPPSAGSASGVLPNPVGYNRVYVHLDEPFTSDAWFRGLSRGRCFVTNGPLLLVTADGQDPGATIKLQSGESRLLRINIQLTSQDPISQVELIKNGNVSHTIKCSDELTQRHTFEFSVDEPGWFLVRAIADVENTFRFATTAPWFVEVGDVEHRISRRSVQFFLDWVNERIERVKANIEDDAEARTGACLARKSAGVLDGPFGNGERGIMAVPQPHGTSSDPRLGVAIRRPSLIMALPARLSRPIGPAFACDPGPCFPPVDLAMRTWLRVLSIVLIVALGKGVIWAAAPDFDPAHLRSRHSPDSSCALFRLPWCDGRKGGRARFAARAISTRRWRLGAGHRAWRSGKQLLAGPNSCRRDAAKRRESSAQGN